MSDLRTLRVNKRFFPHVCDICRGLELRNYSVELIDEGPGDFAAFGTIVPGDGPLPFGAQRHGGPELLTIKSDAQVSSTTLLCANGADVKSSFHLHKNTAFLPGDHGGSVAVGSFCAIHKLTVDFPRAIYDILDARGFAGPLCVHHDEDGAVVSIQFGCDRDELYLLFEIAQSPKVLLSDQTCDGPYEWAAGVHVSLPWWPVSGHQSVLPKIPYDILKHFWLTQNVAVVEGQFVSSNGDIGCATARADNCLLCCRRIWRTLHNLTDIIGEHVQFRVDFMARLKEVFASSGAKEAADSPA